MKYTLQDLHRAKSVDITEFLAERGINPSHQSGRELVYLSPLKDESTPSFYVNTLKNVFNDFSTGCKGDIITLVQELDKINYSGAMETLLNFTGGSKEINFERTNKPQNEEKKVVDKKIFPLHSQILINYFRNQRMIKESLVKEFIKEINYRNEHGTFYGGCWKNDAGGYEIRNPKFKGCIGKKAPTTFKSKNDVDTLTVFEGYLDFLSWLTILGKTAMSNTDVVVLNSLSTLTIQKIGSFNANYDNIDLYFDNDEAGAREVERIKKSIPYRKITDYSKTFYPNYKDLNDFLCQKQNPNYKG